MSTNEIMKVIKDHKDERFILGIDGLSRSGKTTLVKKLEENMKQMESRFIFFILTITLPSVTSDIVLDLQNGMSTTTFNGI